MKDSAAEIHTSFPVPTGRPIASLVRYPESKQHFGHIGPTTIMDTIFREFGEAFSSGNGYQLSQTLTPQLPKDMLRVIWKSANHHDVKQVLRRGIQNSNSSPMNRLTRDEIDGWVEVYFAYWKACEHLLAMEEGGGNVSTFAVERRTWRHGIN